MRDQNFNDIQTKTYITLLNLKNNRTLKARAHLTPSLPVSDLELVLEVSGQFVASWENPDEASTVRRLYHGR